MRLLALIIVCCTLISSCKKKDSSIELKDDLMNSMKTYLYNGINNDSSNVKYRVLDVNYFEDKDKFICEFKVNMKTKLFDTTGIMKANITKDLKTVDRLY